MLNSFVQSVSLDVVDHLVGAVRFEIGKSSETPATSEGKSTLPQTTTLPTSETGLGSWSSLALACQEKEEDDSGETQDGEERPRRRTPTQ